MENNKKIVIFLVDDDDFLLEMYALKFKASGFDIEVAHGGDEALTKFKEGLKPDVMLLDVVMPKMDGFEFLEEVKKEKLLGNCLVMILSNLGNKDDVDRGKQLGVSDYIVKASFTPTEVVEKVKLLLQKSKQ